MDETAGVMQWARVKGMRQKIGCRYVGEIFGNLAKSWIQNPEAKDRWPICGDVGTLLILEQRQWWKSPRGGPIV